VNIAVNMAAPKSIIEQVLRAISLIPFARTTDEIEVARTHLSISFSNLGAMRIAVRSLGLCQFGGLARRDVIYYGDHHSMAIAIEVSSQV
jgi:hypothetical protein